MWNSAYNVLDLNSQAWGTDRWRDARCTQSCIDTCGDYVTEAGADYTYDLIQPVASAKITTRVNLNMKYGRLEVEAKLPKGDVQWPAIWCEWGLWRTEGACFV